MEFEIAEIKGLGGSATNAFCSVPENLSLRLQSRLFPGDRVFTIHAVVPFSPEFANAQIGQKFKFERFEEPLQKLTESERRQFLKEHGVSVKKEGRV